MYVVLYFYIPPPSHHNISVCWLLRARPCVCKMQVKINLKSTLKPIQVSSIQNSSQVCRENNSIVKKCINKNKYVMNVCHLDLRECCTTSSFFLSISVLMMPKSEKHQRISLFFTFTFEIKFFAVYYYRTSYIYIIAFIVHQFSDFFFVLFLWFGNNAFKNLVEDMIIYLI